MKILLTNDDGVDAPGILAFEKAMAGFGMLTVVAPSGALSGCGHRVTTDEALQVKQIRPGIMSVDGTPADCVRVAMHSLLPKVDWVVSGINAGGNLGVDIFISGTVAAVREAAFHGIPGIAISQYRKRGAPMDWARSEKFARSIVTHLIAKPITPGTYWNVNLPHLEESDPDPEFVFCKPNSSPLPLAFKVEGESFKYAGDYHSRHAEQGTDVEACFSGKIAISLLGVF